MPPDRIRTRNPSEWPQTYALDRAATGIGCTLDLRGKFPLLQCSIFICHAGDGNRAN